MRRFRGHFLCAGRKCSLVLSCARNVFHPGFEILGIAPISVEKFVTYLSFHRLFPLLVLRSLSARYVVRWLEMLLEDGSSAV